VARWKLGSAVRRGRPIQRPDLPKWTDNKRPEANTCQQLGSHVGVRSNNLLAVRAASMAGVIQTGCRLGLGLVGLGYNVVTDVLLDDLAGHCGMRISCVFSLLSAVF
jgi:hypothetical protein